MVKVKVAAVCALAAGTKHKHPLMASKRKKTIEKRPPDGPTIYLKAVVRSGMLLKPLSVAGPKSQLQKEKQRGLR